MSINNPIIPPGSPLQRTHPVKNSKLVLAVSVVLVVHILVLAGLLIQGCKRQDTTATTDQDLGTNSQPAFGTTTQTPTTEQTRPAPPPTRDTVSTPSNPARVAPVTTPPAMETSGPTPTVSEAPAAAGATSQAGTSAPPRTSAGSATAEQEGGQVVYIVKTGDNLTKIATAHGTTVKAIRALNGLKTDRILVGQKLKVPIGGAAPSSTEKAAPTPTAASPH